MAANKDDAAAPAAGGALTPPGYKVGYKRPPIEHQFKPGNPGRPKGSRNKLGERFIAAMCADFEEHGASVIERVREEDPAVYLRVVAGLVPAHVLVHEARLDELSDEELATYLIAVRQALGLRDAEAAETALAVLRDESEEATESEDAPSEP